VQERRVGQEVQGEIVETQNALKAGISRMGGAGRLGRKGRKGATGRLGKTGRKGLPGIDMNAEYNGKDGKDV